MDVSHVFPFICHPFPIISMEFPWFSFDIINKFPWFPFDIINEFNLIEPINKIYITLRLRKFCEENMYFFSQIAKKGCPKILNLTSNNRG
jgi:hypothetical protein